MKEGQIENDVKISAEEVFESPSYQLVDFNAIPATLYQGLLKYLKGRPIEEALDLFSSLSQIQVTVKLKVSDGRVIN